MRTVSTVSRDSVTREARDQETVFIMLFRLIRGLSARLVAKAARRRLDSRTASIEARRTPDGSPQALGFDARRANCNRHGID